jgi:hypothetical protein
MRTTVAGNFKTPIVFGSDNDHIDLADKWSRKINKLIVDFRRKGHPRQPRPNLSRQVCNSRPIGNL